MKLGARNLNRRCRNLPFVVVVVYLTLHVSIWYVTQPCLNDPMFDPYTNYTSRPVSPMATKNKPFIIENKNTCDVKRLPVLILVHSSTDHFSRRSAFRQTWANKNLFSGNELRVAFVLGTTSDHEIQKGIENENDRYRDIVQGDFVDSYVNLTHKAITGLRWVDTNCPQAEFIVKVDDDVFLNVFQLFQKIHNQFRYRQKHIWCHMLPERTDVIPRHETKWDVPTDEFSEHMCYPFAFCRGYVVIFTRDLVSSLFEKAKSTTFFHLDDVFVYGMLAGKIEHVTHEYLDKITSYEKESMQCYLDDKLCDYLVSKVEEPGVMPWMWKRVQRANDELYYTNGYSSPTDSFTFQTLLIFIVYIMTMFRC